MARKLPNYLRRHRKRAGLTQREVGKLAGGQTGSKVSRYERFKRLPTLRTALALEAILGVPVRKLFAGIYEDAKREAARCAGYMVRRQRQLDRDPATARKIARLEALTEEYLKADDVVVEPIEEA